MVLTFTRIQPLAQGLIAVYENATYRNVKLGTGKASLLPALDRSIAHFRNGCPRALTISPPKFSLIEKSSQSSILWMYGLRPQAAAP